MARLVFSLFGGYQATLDGLPLLSFESDKGRALLAYLAVESQRSHRREALAALLWPNRPEAPARANLRQALHGLSDTLGHQPDQLPFLLVTAQEIQFNRRSDYTLDVEDFQELLGNLLNRPATAIGIGEADLDRMEKAMCLYRGDFMSGFTLPRAPNFQWWMLSKQEEYHRLAMLALSELTLYYQRNQDYPGALRYVRQILSLEPWSELAHQNCMRLLVLSGQRVAALRQYDACKEVLAVEMGIAPSPLTDRLRDQILAGTYEG